MVFLFNRVAEVRIGKPGEEGLVINNLRTQFKIIKGKSTKTDNSFISIFNMNKDSRGFIEGEELDFILNVGYSDVNSGLKLHRVFSGDVTRAEHSKKGSDIISKLIVIDKKEQANNTHIEENFKEGTDTEDILKTVLKRYGLTSIGINRIINRIKDRGISQLQKQTINGISIFGNFKEVMNKILDRENLEWTINDGEVIVDNDTPDPTTATVISKDTGMIDIPIKREKGIEVISLIQEGLNVGRTIKIVSEFITGFFKIRQVIYEGDTLDGKWQARMITE